ncbi:MAG: dockerin type I repeat-containing protein [Candidatus Zixiibacteriota bacterium]|nr:MAG: dockerin type I repeat-containing protein [candidate division Zixibacteria bacterium]
MRGKIAGAFFCLLVTIFPPVMAAGVVNDIASSPSTLTSPDSRFSEDVIVYTAHQDWLSRIYILRMNGTVIDFFEYSFYFFADLEVVNNEAYVAEAFAPRAYRVDLLTGALDLVIDDWSLYYFYDLAFAGTYFYLNEWDLNRYDIDGNKDGMVSFDEAVHGGAWDGDYYWTLTDANLIKCWNVSTWPSVTEVPENAFAPPTSECRGLWFDGQYFWTAESIDGILGHIYQFNHRGAVINQWLEPAFRGWSACVIRATDFPAVPGAPSGPVTGETGIGYEFSTNTTDPEEDSVFFWFDWGDGANSGWLGPYASGDTCTASNSWSDPETYSVKVKAKDVYDHESDWSEALSITVYARGDCNGDGIVNVGDVLYLINYLYKDGSGPLPSWTGDVNCDREINLGDAVYLINYLFKNGPPPCEQ